MRTCVRTTGKHACFSVKAGACLTLCSCSHQSTTTKQVLTYKKRIANAYNYRFMQLCTKIVFTRKSAFRYPHVFWTISPKLYKRSLSFLCSDAAKITEHAELVNGKLRSCAFMPDLFVDGHIHMHCKVNVYRHTVRCG